MPQDMNNQSTPNAGDDGGSGDNQQTPPTPAPPVATAPNTPLATPPEPANVISSDEVAKRIEKARSDEKAKAYKKIDSLKEEQSAKEKRIAELEEKLQSTEQNLDEVRKGKASEMDSVTKEMQQLREDNKKLGLMIEEVASTATEKIQQTELKAYREAKIREAGLEFTDAVIGESEEEIDASIAKLKQQEEVIRQKVERDLRAKIANDLPQPLSPDGAQGRGPVDLTPQNRRATASLKGEDYQKKKQELLEEAKLKVSLSG